MSAHVPVEPRVVKVGILNKNGRAGWPQVLALQFSVMITRLERELEELQAAVDECAICGGRPCLSPSFCRACSAADKCSQPKPKSFRRPSPETLVEAIMCAVRERGTSALKEPKIMGWLRECDEAAKAQINRRIAKLTTTCDWPGAGLR